MYKFEIHTEQHRSVVNGETKSKWNRNYWNVVFAVYFWLLFDFSCSAHSFVFCVVVSLCGSPKFLLLLLLLFAKATVKFINRFCSNARFRSHSNLSSSKQTKIQFLLLHAHIWTVRRYRIVDGFLLLKSSWCEKTEMWLTMWCIREAKTPTIDEAIVENVTSTEWTQCDAKIKFNTIARRWVWNENLQ